MRYIKRFWKVASDRCKTYTIGALVLLIIFVGIDIYEFTLNNKAETEIENTKKALETNNTETIKEATEKLTKVFYEMSEQLYKNGNPNAGADANATTGASEANTNNAGNDGNVYDADYKVEDDNK